jgi:hypothetical protein
MTSIVSLRPSFRNCHGPNGHSEGGAAPNPAPRSRSWRRPKNLLRRTSRAEAAADTTVRPSGRFFGRRTSTGSRGGNRGRASLNPKNLRATPRTVISRERRTSPAGTPHPGRDREIYYRYAGGQLRRSALAQSCLVATGRVVRAAASGHAVDEIGFLGPATRAASRKCGAAGPRNDTSVFIPQRACGAERRRMTPSAGSAMPRRVVLAVAAGAEGA